MKLYIQYIKEIGLPLFFFTVFFLLDPFSYGYLGGYALVGLIVIKKNLLMNELDLDFFILLVFSVCYSLFTALNAPVVYIQTVLFQLFFPATFYLLGKYLLIKLKDVKYLPKLLVALGLIYSVSALISIILNLRQGGFIQIGRTIPMFWNGREVLATLMGVYFTFNMCIPALLLIKPKGYSLIEKVILAFVFVLSMLCVFRLGSRTQTFICVAAIFVSFIYLLPKQSVLKNLKLIFTLILVIGLIYKFVPFDLNADYLSTLGQRLQESQNAGSAGGRSGRWTQSIEYLFKKPLGWSVDEFGFSHNLWLDVARTGTVISFFILVIFSIKNFLITKRALVISKNNMAISHIILIYTVAANLMLFVEPITEGAFSFFVLYCLIQGVLKKYVSLPVNSETGSSSKFITV